MVEFLIPYIKAASYQLHHVVAFLQLLHELLHPAELLVDLRPGDDPGVDDVVQLEDDQAVGQVGVHPVDEGGDS